MANYEKNRKQFEKDRFKKVSPLEINKQGSPVQNIPTYLPESQQSIQQSVQQNIQQAAGASISTAKQQGGIGLFKNIPYLVNTDTSPYVKIYDSTVDGELRDILFVNGHTTESLNFNLFLSRLDLKNILGKVQYPNQSLENNKETVFLACNMLLAQAGTAPSNPKQLSLSEIVGTTQILSSGIQKPFYIYVHKTNNTNGQLDVTVMK